MSVIKTDIKLSIIIPVYKVEKHLRGCMDSLLSGMPDGVEIVLVDDGSPDGCPAICDAYERRNDCVRAIHRENGGLAAARNTGIAAAKGEYLCFIDSDDVTAEDFPASVLPYLERGDDIVCFPYFIDDEQTHSVRSTALPELVSGGAAEAVRLLEEHSGLNMAWNKLYRSAFLAAEPKNTFLAHSEPGEDLIFNCGCFLKAEKVSLVDLPYYHWIRRGEDTLANRFRRDLNEKNKLFIEWRCRLYRGLGLDQTDFDLLAKGNLGYIFSSVPNMYRRKNRFPRKERLAFYREILASEDVARWTESPAVVNPLLKQFKRLYRTGSPGFMDAYYAAALWGRQSFDGLWQIIRKRMHR